MLRPLAIAVIGSLFTSLLLSLVATPVFYYLLVRTLRLEDGPRPTTPVVSSSTSVDENSPSQPEA